MAAPIIDRGRTGRNVKSKVYAGFDKAIPDGATIMFPGFAGVGIPRNLTAALLDRGARNLTGIANGSGGRDDQIDTGALLRAGQFKKMVLAFTASPHPSNVTIFDELYQSDRIEAELVPQGTLAEAEITVPPGLSEVQI